MRTIEYSTRFKKDYKRESKGQYRKTLDADLEAVLSLLLSDTPLPTKYKDHILIGNWGNYRECHIKPDLLLIYQLPDENTLSLARLGSHSELFS
ncbi:type II toxin-antitoxin system YafQ family toxin [Entomobacter blattae]|uniref:mRNA interferase toxin YafQ n=1 Tax=Entomobacter blattae TaxID=2762277 RepID=A0A7H1NTT4_9PROT|nr:type II toxin-antitoxin system YafQ family toxin [Entomobacter blattae]QNT79194.1 mRNA interferase toxin YafQ [Entomobacter blattae]